MVDVMGMLVGRDGWFAVGVALLENCSVLLL